MCLSLYIYLSISVCLHVCLSTCPSVCRSVRPSSYFCINTSECHYGPVRNFPSLMDFSKSVLFLLSLFPVFNFAPFNICLCTVSPSVFSSSSSSTSLWIIVQCLTYFPCTNHSINMTNLFEPSYSDKYIYIILWFLNFLMTTPPPSSFTAIISYKIW